MDPNLKEYSLPEALCLCFLAKDCVKDDPMLRPTMDDIMTEKNWDTKSRAIDCKTL